MGNNSSRSEIIAKSLTQAEQQWRNSTPRQLPQLQHKVLPEKNIDTKLRPTNNGEILHNGGTLSRKSNITIGADFEICRSNSISSHSSEKYNDVEKHRSFLNHHEEMPSRKNSGCNGFTTECKDSHAQTRQDAEKNGMKKSHVCSIMDVKDRYKNRKKYRAPSPPIIDSGRKFHDEPYNMEFADKSAVRRSRLFKTQAEVKNKRSSPLASNDSNGKSSLAYENKFRKSSKSPPPSLQRTRSMPELQTPVKTTEKTKELQKVDDKKRNYNQQGFFNLNTKVYDDSCIITKNEKLKTLDRNLSPKEHMRIKIAENNWNLKEEFQTNRSLQTSELVSDEISPISNVKPQPKKTFYFGMKDCNEDIAIHEDNIAKNIPLLSSITRRNSVSNSSDSDASSEAMTKVTSQEGIALNLRPILPKKQLEIPRFSPASAWKMLSTLENQTSSTISGEENSFLVEEKIKKRPRNPPPPPPILQVGSRSNNDKSGDSGISGDAPPIFDDSPEVGESRNDLMLPLMLSESHPTSWTPQQDLQEEETSEEESSNKILFESIPSSNFASRRNVFSLSLPRDNRFATYIDNKGALVNTSLQRFKNSVTGVLNNFGRKEPHENGLQNHNSNWFLSKSVPHSLNNNGFRSLDFQNHKIDEDNRFAYGQQNTGRLMYLPELKNRYSSHEEDRYQMRMRNHKKTQTNSRDSKMSSYLSKSHENISSIASISNNDKVQNLNQKMDEKANKPKRFTFQSTIRQIERRRLAEKLSKEAEIKEKQRLSEFEAMQRVEREFQQKRAREKATIKQKLRLFSFEEANYFSLPFEATHTNDLFIRQDPDGAVSSARSSPNASKQQTMNNNFYEMLPESKENIMKNEQRSSLDNPENNLLKAQATQVLSEYRQLKREYKDFKSNRYFNDSSACHVIKPTTVYPEITYNIPKAYGYQHSECM